MSDNLFRLDGRVAVISAAGGAFGRAISRGFARAGARLLLSDIDAGRLEAVAELARAEGAAVETCLADVGSSADVERVFAAVDAAYGQVDVLVNIAGIGHRSPPEQLALEGWEQTMRVNMTGTFLMSVQAGRRMIARGAGGSIINFSSIAGSNTLGRGSIAYGATKRGVDAITQEMAVEWGQYGIRVNAIKPCQFLNEGWRARVADPTEGALVKHVVAGIPLGRIGEPEEMLGPVLFLASDAASMVSGVLLPVDGGNLAMNPTFTH